MKSTDNDKLWFTLDEGPGPTCHSELCFLDQVSGYYYETRIVQLNRVRIDRGLLYVQIKIKFEIGALKNI